MIASDIDPYYVRILTDRFRTNAERPRRVVPVSADRRAIGRISSAERINTIVCLNVLEHIEHDRSTLLDCAPSSRRAAASCCSCPSMPALYGTLDVNLQHYRRYDKGPLAELLKATGFEVETLRYVNRVAVFGWWLSSRILKRKALPREQLAVFKVMMPLLRFEEKRAPSFGLSLLALARKR